MSNWSQITEKQLGQWGVSCQLIVAATKPYGFHLGASCCLPFPYMTFIQTAHNAGE